MNRGRSIIVKETEIAVLESNDKDFISLTDMARFRNPNEPSQVIANWLRLYNTISFLGLWETIHNPNFNSFNFEGIEKEAGRDYFMLHCSARLPPSFAWKIQARKAIYEMRQLWNS